jgi:hypothetical protein
MTKKIQRYFICKLSVPHSTGTVDSSSVVVCETFVNLNFLQESTLKSIKAEAPHLIIKGTPTIDFLYEMTEEEYEAYIYVPNQGEADAVCDATKAP